MKSFLKVALYMLLGAILLLVIGGGAFAWFIYKNVNKYVLNYTCNDFVTDAPHFRNLAQTNNDTKPTVDEQMKVLGLTSMLMQFSMVMSDGTDAIPTKDDKVDQVKLNDYANKLYGMCKTFPDYNMINETGKLTKKDNELWKAVHGNVDKLLALSKVEENPDMAILSTILAQGLNDRLELAHEVERQISATTPVSNSMMVSSSENKK